jgi:hypothetical protein
MACLVREKMLQSGGGATITIAGKTVILASEGKLINKYYRYILVRSISTTGSYMCRANEMKFDGCIDILMLVNPT